MAVKVLAAARQSGAESSEQSSGDSDLCELKGNGATVPDDLGPDLDELIAQGGQ